MKNVQFSNLTVKAVVDLFIYAQGADTSSILGIVLGNFGLNINNFCTEFNNYTKELPSYFLLRARIIVYENRTFAFSITLGNIGYFLKLLSFEQSVKYFHKGYSKSATLDYLFIDDFFAVFRLKFPHLSLKRSFSLFFSVLNSCHINLVV